MKRRIGLLYQGNERDWIWGSAITTFYLAAAFERLGHETWRASVTEAEDWSSITTRYTDLLILEGVPRHQVPAPVWDRSAVKVFWWLSDLFYDQTSVAKAGFDAVATNSIVGVRALRKAAIPAALIELAAPPEFAAATPRPAYRTFCTYLGSYPHKSDEQMAMLLRPATTFGLSIWGCGWQNSPYCRWHRGVLPFGEIGSLYRSATVVLALTEQRQQALGMLNNRIFEALAAGSIILSERYDYLQSHTLGPYLYFTDSPEQTTDMLTWIRDYPDRDERAQLGKTAVLRQHGYDSRAVAFLALLDQIERGAAQ